MNESPFLGTFNQLSLLHILCLNSFVPKSPDVQCIVEEKKKKKKKNQWSFVLEELHLCQSISSKCPNSSFQWDEASSGVR
jgi:hypothetical protein